jgi:hypothetical protein
VSGLTRFQSFLVENRALLVGDVLAMALVTAVGFATHGTLATAGARLLTTFIPLVVAWFLVAPHLGVYNRSMTLEARQLWRPFWAMILAAPLAAWLRGLLLGNAAILPIFVAVLGLFSALGMLAWRASYGWALRRRLEPERLTQGPQHG